VFENRVLRVKFWYKGKEVAAGWKKLHIEELHNLNSSSNFITYLLTPWCRTLFEKLIVTQLVLLS